MNLKHYTALALVGLLGGGPAFAVGWFLQEIVGLGQTAVFAGATAVLVMALILLDLALIGLGGIVLQRFDVARDRG